jgi:hypothetical protein
MRPGGIRLPCRRRLGLTGPKSFSQEKPETPGVNAREASGQMWRTLSLVILIFWP